MTRQHLLLTENESLRSELLDRLWRYQQDHGYITDQDISECSKRLNISQIELEGVVSFYHFFHREPPGKTVIYLNNSIVSESKGFARVRDAFERETGATCGGADPSGQFGLYETACIGLSDQEPAALIDFYPFTNLNTLKVKHIIAELKRGMAPVDICDQIPDNIRHRPDDTKCMLLRDYQPGSAINLLKDLSPEEVIEEIRKSGLRGMGGAFFPVAIKWDACRSQDRSPKFVVCNADEGEPGTFKDRVLMTAYPGLMLEGMVLAAYAIGAAEGIIYLRAEYKWLQPNLRRTIDQYRKMHLLGEQIAGIDGFNFDIRIQTGAGAYVCGEETALLNSLEGKRGEPRTKQFFPTERGFFGYPTVVNNVETFCAAARVIELGADRYLATGTVSSPGTKLISVSGDCHQPGIYEIEWGTTVGEILAMCEADDPWFIQVSGPSGQCISVTEKDRQLSLDDLRCGGSFMIFNSNRELLSILSNFSHFFKHESCGVCTPCRAGNFIIQRKLDKVALKLAYPSDYDEIREWGKIMQMTSRCGLGKTATNSLLMALDKFPEYFDLHVDHHKDGLNKTFHLDQAVQEYENFRN